MAFLELNFFSDVLGLWTTANVVLPEREHDDDTFPVLFLLHGSGDDHTTWMRRTSIERYANRYGMAVIMPPAQKGWYADCILGYRWRTFIGAELPFICRSFFPGMSSRREDVGIAGNSMGGYGSLAISLTYPETFGFAAPLSAAFDPTYMYKDDPHRFTDMFGSIDNFAGSPNDLFSLSEKVKNEGKPLPELYIRCGTGDPFLGANRRMHDRLTSLGYNVSYAETEGNHNWDYWDKEIPDVLECFNTFRKEH